MTERLHFHFSLSCIREGNGKPLQYSCLENPREGGGWWSAVYGVAQSRIRLKRLSSRSSNLQFQGQVIPSSLSPTLGIAQLRSWLREGNGNPLQYSCLENPVDRGTWWAAVHRVTQSRTQLKQLSMRACIGERNCNPLQYSCPENPVDRGAWWAAVYGVAQSRTRLKRLSSSSSSCACCWQPPGQAVGSPCSLGRETALGLLL